MKLRNLMALRSVALANQDEAMALWLTARVAVLSIASIILLSIIVEEWQKPDFYFTNAAISSYFTYETFLVGNITHARERDNLQPDFFSMSSTAHVWLWLESQVLPFLQTDEPKVLKAHTLLGNVRLRQLRVTNHSCDVYPIFEGKFTTCYGPYTLGKENTDSFGPGGNRPWVWSSPEELGGGTYPWAEVATYGGGGFVFDLTPRCGMNVLADLREKRWLDEGTRALFVEFNLYNYNTNCFTLAKFYVEFPPTGGVMPQVDVTTLKLISDEDPQHYKSLAALLIYIMGLCWLISKVSTELEVWGWRKFFCVYSNYLEVTFIVVGLPLAGIIMVSYYLTEPEVLKSLTSSAYVELLEVRKRYEALRYCTVILVFFSWVRMLCLSDFGPHSKLTATLYRALPDVASFTFMFVLIMCAFSMMGYLLFGSDLKEFRTFHNSLYVLLHVIIGQLDYESLSEVSRVMGPLFYVSFILFIVVVLYNMFTVILNDTYFAVREEGLHRDDMYEVLPFLKHCCLMVLTKCGYRPKRPRKSKKRLPLRALRTLFHHCNVPAKEISEFIFKVSRGDTRREVLVDDMKRLSRELSQLQQHAAAWEDFTHLWVVMRDVETHAAALNKLMDELLPTLD